jgi:hypothetical protein
MTFLASPKRYQHLKSVISSIIKTTTYNIKKQTVKNLFKTCNVKNTQNLLFTWTEFGQNRSIHQTEY